MIMGLCIEIVSSLRNIWAQDKVESDIWKCFHAVLVKFENIMFENKSPEAEIKVIDFGLSKKFGNNQIGIMHEGVGTLYSMCPQVLQGVYTSQADLWSVGVMTYMLLSSHRPFFHKRRKVMIDRIMRVDYNFDKDYWKLISLEAKDMINSLLVLDPKKRMDAGRALKHIWLSNQFKLSDRLPDQSTADAVQENLIHYKETSSLKKIALNVSCECGFKFWNMDGSRFLISGLIYYVY
jgi:calcium-dependent protein kinase